MIQTVYLTSWNYTDTVPKRVIEGAMPPCCEGAVLEPGSHDCALGCHTMLVWVDVDPATNADCLEIKILTREFWFRIIIEGKGEASKTCGRMVFEASSREEADQKFTQAARGLAGGQYFGLLLHGPYPTQQGAETATPS